MFLIIVFQAEKLIALIEAAGLEVKPIWPTIFAKTLAGKDLDSLLFSFSAGIISLSFLKIP